MPDRSLAAASPSPLRLEELARLRARLRAELRDGAPARRTAQTLGSKPEVQAAIGPPSPHERRLALRNCGIIEPASLEEFIARDGYLALERALSGLDAGDVLATLSACGLCTLGGGELGDACRRLRDLPREESTLVCSAFEIGGSGVVPAGILASDPHAVIEGMVVVAAVTGVTRGVIALPAGASAARLLAGALERAHSVGLLGDHVLASGLSFEIETWIGNAGRVLGEPSALLEAIAGRRAMPRAILSGADARGRGVGALVTGPAVWAKVPAVLLQESEPASGEESAGPTWVVSVHGPVRRPGIAEVPADTPLRVVVEEIGGGLEDGRPIAAILVGGVTGRLLPMADAVVTVGAAAAASADAGAGVLEVRAVGAGECVVDLCRALLGVAASSSCGKCTPCRVGAEVMVSMLDAVAVGAASSADVAALAALARHIRATSLCRLGRACAEPLLSVLEHFPADVEAHLRRQPCPARATGET